MAPTNATHTNRKLGAVERLGRKSAPAPQAALKRGSLNVSRAGGRPGRFYEKASSRSSRERLALSLHGNLGRDDAVALGAPNRRPQKRKRTVLTGATLDEQFEQKGRERMTNLSRMLAAGKPNSRGSSKENNRRNSSLPLKERPRVAPPAKTTTKKTKKSPTTTVSTAAAVTRREAVVAPRGQNFADWSTDRVVEWLREINPSIHQKYEKAFRDEGVDGKMLESMEDSDLLEDVGVASKMHRKRLLGAIEELKKRTPTSASSKKPRLGNTTSSVGAASVPLQKKKAKSPTAIKAEEPKQEVIDLT